MSPLSSFKNDQFMAIFISSCSHSWDEIYDVFQFISIIIVIDAQMVPLLVTGRLFN